MAINNKTPLTVNSVIDYLTSITRRTAVFKKLDLRLLRIVRADINRILEQREDLLENERVEELKRRTKIQEHLSLLKKDGIEPDELLGESRPRKRPSIGPLRSYRIDGELIHYKGVGKYPGKLREVIEKEGVEALARYEVSNE